MKYLVLGPGAMGIYAMIGRLKLIHKELRDVQEISGASAGSILALFLALGMSVDKILRISLSLDISEFVKVNIALFFNKFGFVDVEPIRKKLIEVCGCNPTFKELKKKIYVAAFCLNSSKTEYFSVDTHPDMKVIDAVCMSIAIPLVFECGKYEGRTYVDGGVAEEIPLAPFLDKRPYEIECVKVHVIPKYKDDLDNPKQFLETIITSTLRNRGKYSIRIKSHQIDIEDFNIFDFNMEYEDKVRLYMLGHNL